MTIITYQSPKYDANRTYRRYVRADQNGGYQFCEFADGFDFRQGTATADELPETIRDAADALEGYFPSYVDWPQ